MSGKCMQLVYVCWKTSIGLSTRIKLLVEMEGLRPKYSVSQVSYYLGSN